MSKIKQPSRQEATVSNVDLKTKIEAVRKEIDKALVAGDPTGKLRNYLRELETMEAAQPRPDPNAEARARQRERDAEDEAIRVLATRHANEMSSRIADNVRRFEV
jgi:hypothetical protein